MAKYETAKYEVIEKDGNFEIRKYKEFYSASIDEDNIIQSNGFNHLFNYISGENMQNKKISMTTPVINTIEDNNSSTEFVMPEEYSSKDLPSPNDQNIKINKNKWDLTASVRFSGTISIEKISYYEKELLNWIAKKQLIAIGSFKLARYNPPFIPPFLRKNELLINVK